MYICLNHRCRAVFDAGDVVETIIDRHPYGEGYAAEYGRACPVCGGIEISDAFQCARCGEYFPSDEVRCYAAQVICPDCADQIEDEPDTDPIELLG